MRRRRTRRNPEWSWSLLDTIWDRLRARCRSDDLMPIPDSAPIERPTSRGWARSTAHARANPQVKEYGSGYFGVVMPTRNPKWVFKITRDASEAQFWNILRKTHKRCSLTGIAHCSPVYRIPESMDYAAPWLSRAWVLWREAAEVAGEDVWPHFLATNRKTMAQQAQHRILDALDNLRHRGWEASALEAYRSMALNPLLAGTAEDLVALTAETGVVVTDIHLGNWGVMARRPRHLTLIDPGLVKFIDRSQVGSIPLL